MSERDPQLFYDGYCAALRDDCKAIEPTEAWAKVVGKMLFPEKEILAARGALLDKTNPEKRDRLTDEQERLIMTKAREVRGFSAALYHICDCTGFERPRAKAPKDEALELQSRGERLLAELKQITERQERLLRAPLSMKIA